ncbi:THUMP domain-containing class I SAM-dependent RNA methyltransferase [Thermovibrio sp.]
MNLFAVSPPGIEEITLKELEGLGIKGELKPGGVEFEGDLRELYLTNLWLRSANRVLVRLCSFRARHFGELVRKAQKCPWEEFISRELPLKIRVTSKASKLYHTKAIEERIVKAIKLKLGFEPLKAKYEDEGTSLIVRFEKDLCTISVNSSGAPLYKRGYRVREVEAPLRENLAAAMVLFSGWKGEEPLIDPFCGSGTIPIEGALVGLNLPPGGEREFAFMRWQNFNSDLFKELLKEAESKKRELSVPILGFDIDPLAVEGAKKNAKAAEVESFVKFTNRSFPPLSYERATVITNPPYGVRLKGKRLRELYRLLGQWCLKSFKEFKLLFLSPRRELALETGLNPKQITYFDNGGLKVGLFVAQRKL